MVYSISKIICISGICGQMYAATSYFFMEISFLLTATIKILFTAVTVSYRKIVLYK